MVSLTLRLQKLVCAHFFWRVKNLTRSCVDDDDDDYDQDEYLLFVPSHK